MKDALGERIKSQYEDRTRFSIPRRTYSIIRLDGKSFHTYTKGLNKPFDEGLITDMDSAIVALCKQVQGMVFAYTQSDEISLLLTDFATTQTNAWFDGNIQKIASVSASIITAEFNKLRWIRRNIIEETVTGKSHFNPTNTAYFDARVFTIPDPTEVYNYFVWRQQDCMRNSVSMVAQSLFSHKELHGKSTVEMQEMMFQKHQLDWSYYNQSHKNGRLIIKEEYLSKVDKENVDKAMDNLFCCGKHNLEGASDAILRTRWISTPAWKFTEDPKKLQSMIPKYD
jgi:tRNA(His) 5'-end guanylyltransferase